MSEEKKLKTLKNLKEKDNERSGCLTPENGVDYDYSKGEPKYHTEYKINYSELRSVAREWIKELQDENEIFISDGKIGKYDKDTFIYYNQEARDRFLNNIAKIDWIKHFFNLEDE